MKRQGMIHAVHSTQLLGTPVIRIALCQVKHPSSLWRVELQAWLLALEQVLSQLSSPQVSWNSDESLCSVFNGLQPCTDQPPEQQEQQQLIRDQHAASFISSLGLLPGSTWSFQGHVTHVSVQSEWDQPNLGRIRKTIVQAMR
jgi:hypothetical protein